MRYAIVIPMSEEIKNYKLELCEEELKALLRKLIDGGYHVTAAQVYDHIANTGVELDLKPELRNQKTMEEFLAEK